MKKFSKQSWEAFVISGSIIHDLDTDESINLETSTVSAIDKTGADATAIVLDAAGLTLVGTDKLKVYVKGGTADLSPYIITFKVETNAVPYPNKFELDIQMNIQEIGIIN